jgi:hypothetical protein
MRGALQLGQVLTSGLFMDRIHADRRLRIRLLPIRRFWSAIVASRLVVMVTV